MSPNRSESQEFENPKNTSSEVSLISKFVGLSLSPIESSQELDFAPEELLGRSQKSDVSSSGTINVSLETLAAVLTSTNVSSEADAEVSNKTELPFKLESSSVFLFDRRDIQALLILLYIVVFITGFVGNLLVLIVMWLHPHMRSTTNFFLTNLAIADFCVTIFCVLQNLSLYLAQSWIFGDFLCKMYNFINALSYTSSVMILVVNCIERYIAIMSPFRAKTILRHRNLMIALFVVWVSSGIYCCPRLLYFRAVSHLLSGAKNEVICLADRAMFDSRTFDTISFILLYLVPLTVISVLYLRIARFLWVNNVQKENAIRRNTVEPLSSKASYTTSLSFTSIRIHRGSTHCDSHREADNYNPCFYEGSDRKSYDDDLPQLRSHKRVSKPFWSRKPKPKAENQSHSYHSKDVIRRWQKVVKLLVAVVTCFAVCNFPYHFRKMLIYYYPGYKATTNKALIAIPLTQVLTYLNSAMNPVLYCFMSDSFRFYIREVLTCQYTWRGKRKATRSYYSTRPIPSSQSQQMKSFQSSKEKNEILAASKMDRF